MSTLDEATTLINRIMYRLDDATQGLPVEQIISELQIAVERISFTGIQTKKDLSLSQLNANLDALFDGELSQNMLEFIHWMAEIKSLNVLSGRTGDMFINYCSKQYRQRPQVYFVTAVELPTETQQRISEKLRPRYPVSSRIIYEVMPSIVAGFIIRDGAKVVDRSLHKKMTHGIKDYIANTTLQGVQYG